MSAAFTLALAATLLGPEPAAPDQLGPGKWRSLPASQVAYHLEHKFHKVDGRSSLFEVRALVRDKDIQVQGRVAVSSFDSGNANRDSNALTVVEANRFPMVRLTATAGPCLFHAGSCLVTLTATLSWHGVDRPYVVPVTLKRLDGGRLLASFSFDVSLAAHNIERPTLLTIPVDDRLRINAAVTLEPAP